MVSTQEKESAADSELLDSLIAEAIKKVNGKAEKDICHYLPSDRGGYIHHFTLKKMKSSSATELLNMISEHILKVEEPQLVQPKARAPKGTRKSKNKLAFTKQEIERLLEHAKAAGDEAIVNKLAPVLDLKSIKKELIASILHSQVNEELFECYRQALNDSKSQPEDI
ncbi:MAG: hypothetical protein K0S07_288 [Chlamydiales bacterium]|jgi:hypothetical protein|nr:hypothetical protein [Chlamydiales bacterium]